MLWNEFIEGTKCRDNAENYKVYQMLEGLYMNNEGLTKEDVYKMAAPLLKNGLTDAEIKQIKEYKSNIGYLKAENVGWQETIKGYQEMIKDYQNEVKKYKEWVADNKREIARMEELIKGIENI